MPNFIAKRRRAMGMKQVDLAAACEITQASVSDIENNKVWPRPEQILKIADTLECAPVELFIDPDAMDLNALTADASDGDKAVAAAMVKAYLQQRRPT